MNAIPARTSTLAIVSLVSGILAWVCLPFVGALVAVICGHLARSEIRNTAPGAIEGGGIAVAGLVLGWLQLVLMVAGIFVVFAFLGGIAFLASVFG
jgi:hypothetical protein